MPRGHGILKKEKKNHPVGVFSFFIQKIRFGGGKRSHTPQARDLRKQNSAPLAMSPSESRHFFVGACFLLVVAQATIRGGRCCS